MKKISFCLFLSAAVIISGLLGIGCKPAIEEGTQIVIADITETSTFTPLPEPTNTPEPSAEDYYNEGVRYFLEERDLEEALEAFNLAIELKPNYGEAYYERGRTYAVLEDYDLAIEDLSYSIEINPENLNSYLMRAWVYDDIGQFQNAILDYDRVIELDPDFAEVYFWRGKGYALVGEGEKAIADFEKALELGLEEEDQQVANEFLAELYEFGQLRVSYDSTWLGTTDQGEQIELVIVENGVQSVLVGFSIPGCEGDSPMSSWFGTPEFFIEDRVLDISLTGLYVINITGIFDSPYSISGNLQISPSNRCNQGLSATWSAVPAQFYEPPPLAPELLERIPNIDIPEILFSADDGADNFQVYSALLGQEGDWFLVRSLDSIIPVPAGWTTTSTGREDLVMIYNKVGLEYLGYGGQENMSNEPEVIISIGDYWSTDQTSAEMVAAAEAAFSEEPTITILKTQIIDSDKAYIFFKVEPGDDTEFYRIYFFSQTADGWIRGLDLMADIPVWEEYYPVIRAIAANWVSSIDGSLLGADLPVSLLE